MLKRRRVSAVIATLVILAAVGLGAIVLYKLNINRYDLQISHDSGIYAESFDLTVRKFSEGTIYYTVDGSTPKAGATGTMVYETAIPITLGEETTACSYQFYCIYEDGTESEIYKRDYILDKQGLSRFTTKYIVSVTGEEEELFGYEKGLFVRGRKFDEYMEKHPDVDILNTVIPANYFNNREVGVHTAVFLQDGSQIIDQNCGLKIYGNVTRAKNQKSFRLVARTDYDLVNEFNYAFLPKLVTEEGQTPINAFQRISLHNSGNDNGYAFVRTELIGELARQSAFQDVLVAESAVVFVNGRYLGVYWLSNTFDDRYFKEKYGNYEGEFCVLEGTTDRMAPKKAETDAETKCVEEYNTFITWAKDADLTDEANWQKVKETLDIDNFAQYMALEYYINNIDWPQNNVKVYRYVCTTDEEYRDNSVFDGRYRYLLFDTDYGMGLKMLGWFGYGAWDKRLEDFCEKNNHTQFFQSCLAREDFRNQFISEVLSLINTTFTRDNVEKTLAEFNGSRYAELYHMMEETDLLKDSLWESDDNGIANAEAEMSVILEYAQFRPAVAVEEMQGQWDCGGCVNLELNTNHIQGIKVNAKDVPVNEAGIYVGTYFEKIPLSITCEKSPGVVIEGYRIGERIMEGEVLTIYPSDWIMAGETLQIEVLARIEAEESLEIKAFQNRGSQDYVVIRNNGQTTATLSHYTISDTMDNPGKGKLPSLQLAPGEEITVYGEEYRGTYAENSCQVAFGWSTEEPVLLVHSVKGIVDIKNQ